MNGKPRTRNYRSIVIDFPCGENVDIDETKGVHITRIGGKEVEENETFALLAAAAMSHFEFSGEGIDKANDLYEKFLDAYHEYLYDTVLHSNFLF